MSFLIVDSLRIQCPSCRSVRLIPRDGGPGRIQVGDLPALEQEKLRRKAKSDMPFPFHLEGWCELCAGPVLKSRAQNLVEALSPIREAISKWVEATREALRNRLAGEIVAVPGEEGVAWLRRTFPDLFQECFSDALCGLQPPFFEKMKKRFKTQAGRQLQRDGCPFTQGDLDWFKDRCKHHPFEEELRWIRQQVKDLEETCPRPWTLANAIDPWQGLNLNPYICTEGTIFMPEGESGMPFYLLEQADPEDLAAVCHRQLVEDLESLDRLARAVGLEDSFRGAIHSQVDHLTWPVPMQ